MEIIKTKLRGVFVVKPNIFTDERGVFVKTFHQQSFREVGFADVFKESFHSSNKKDVIRGMHCQDTEKLVYVTSGRILDVVLNMQTGQYTCHVLSGENREMVYIPRSYAHGFLALEESCVMYLQSEMHSPATELGVRYDSFGMNWGIENPIVSKRDLTLENLCVS